jgi:acyl-CoA thioesterase I
MNARAMLDAAPGFLFTLILSILAAAAAPGLLEAADGDAPITILAFGDSLTAGFGVQLNESFPAQLQMALQAKGHKVQVINAGVSGDTTAGGLMRLDWSLQPKPDGVILELGANDALRGVDPNVPRTNLDTILATLKSKGVEVLFAGMKAPNNWGPEYVKGFNAIYPELAAKYGVALYPFFLEGVALDQRLVQPDGLHPTPAGVAAIVKRMLPDVEALLDRIAQRKTAGK